MTREAWPPGAASAKQLAALKQRIRDVERDVYGSDRELFAKRCDLSVQTIKNWLATGNESRVPGTPSLWRIAMHAGVSADWLLVGRGTMDDPNSTEDAKVQLFKAVRRRMQRTHTRHMDPSSGEAAELILGRMGPEGLWALAVRYTEDLDQIGGEIRATAYLF